MTAPTAAPTARWEDLDAWLPGCDGLVLPAVAGTPVDALRWRNVLARHARASVLAAEIAESDEPTVSRSAGAVVEVLAELPPLVAAAAFDTPYAAWDIPPPALGLEAVEDLRTPRRRALALPRHLVGSPGVTTTVVFPPEAFAGAPLRMPHLGILVASDGAVAAASDGDGAVTLTWDDGVRATLPPGGPPAAALAGAPVLGGRVQAAPTWGDRVWEPSTPDVAAAFAAFGPAEGADAVAVAQANTVALELLAAVWPLAADAAARWLTGLMPLAPRTGLRSHASPRLTGVVLTSATAAVAAGDIICHELAHVRLAAVLEHDPLLRNGGEEGHPSPWRQDPRPLLGVLLGVHAFLDVCGYHRRLVETGVVPEQIADSEQVYARQAAKVREGWKVLEQFGQPTTAGSRVLNALAREVAAL